MINQNSSKKNALESLLVGFQPVVEAANQNPMYVVMGRQGRTGVNVCERVVARSGNDFPFTGSNGLGAWGKPPSGCNHF